ncbi:MFS monocarboxylic acid transporter-like protein [Rhizodiscina lignyota]|uniref:Probable transporter MCH1 n=1 Tax=Rhizodiscina lignyota TaxID=1504668 RepID=A0A9P4M2A5_9PEZI|nr:MFS monocarboxylic acid transporter-like protein [Rhizodiscina lignyota]
MSRPASSSRSRAGAAASTTANGIERLEYKPPDADARRPLLGGDGRDGDGDRRSRSRDTSVAGSFFEQVAEGIQEQDRRRIGREVVRYGGFCWAIVNCLCAGSITAFSLYGPLFLSHLKYTQLQVNLVSITAELAMYLPVPAFGYLCDRIGPGWCSLLSGCFFGIGYILAAFTYHSGPPPSAKGDGWPFWVMVVSFIGVGMGTSCMYLSAVTTCAKNFGRGNYKGLALAAPIAAFGLSGMWLSQVGSHFFSERRPDGRNGDVSVYHFFLFLGLLLLAVGTIGTITLQVVDEDLMIDTAIDHLEQSGLLAEDDEYFRRATVTHGYGTMEPADLSESTVDFLRSEAEMMKAKAEEDRRRKTLLLNAETRRFLKDHTMWWLAAGFFLVTGPGEAFINNMGTIIGTLYPPDVAMDEIPTTPATHVSIVAITSTIARLLTGTLSDLLAPKAEEIPSHLRGPNSLASSLASLEPRPKRFTLSRMVFLLAFAILLSLGQILLASGLIQNHGTRFAAVSALVGAGYGAAFSLVPIVVSVVWGVENIGTNWGIVAMMPAGGAAVWGAIYSAVYESAARREGDGGGDGDRLCYGTACYAPTFWAMAASVWVACGLWFWAWRGKGGWRSRGIAV